jgi:hypothetical protein
MAWSYYFCIALAPLRDFICTAPRQCDMIPVMTADVSRRFLLWIFSFIVALCVLFGKYTKWTHIGDVVPFTRNYQLLSIYLFMPVKCASIFVWNWSRTWSVFTRRTHTVARFEVLQEVWVNIEFFWDMMPCRVID